MRIPLTLTPDARFVSFIANNGTRSTAEVRELANSCASTLRYYEGRDDFNFLRSSRLRLGYYDGEVTLEVCMCHATALAYVGATKPARVWSVLVCALENIERVLCRLVCVLGDNERLRELTNENTFESWCAKRERNMPPLLCKFIFRPGRGRF